jgi:hypothetical protein
MKIARDTISNLLRLGVVTPAPSTSTATSR